MRAVWYQWTLLSVGLLVSIADFFDISLGELAWLIFLVPLLVIYWLILLSIRLSEQTQVLRQSLQRQEELRHYASTITRVQEDERRRLARELHDDTAQALIALARGLDGLKKQVAPHDLPWVTQLQELAEQTVEGVRRACHDLPPAILDDLGLQAAFAWLAESWSARGTVCTFVSSGQERRPGSPAAPIRIGRPGGLVRAGDAALPAASCCPRRPDTGRCGSAFCALTADPRTPGSCRCCPRPATPGTAGPSVVPRGQ